MIESVAIVKKGLGSLTDKLLSEIAGNLRNVLFIFHILKYVSTSKAIENSQLCISKIDRPDAAAASIGALWHRAHLGG